MSLWHILNGIVNGPALKIAGANVGGVLTVNTTQAGTTSVTTEEDLWSYSLPANTLNANGRGVRITAFGSFAANGNTKTLRLKFGGSNIVSYAIATNNSGWEASGIVIRTGASTQLAGGNKLLTNSATLLSSGIVTPAEDTTAAIVIKVTGTNGTASANDIVFRGAVVELLN